MRPADFAGLLFFLAHCAFAQLIVDQRAWVEGPVPAPPAFEISRMITIPLDGPSSLVSGIDPSTLSVGEDRVVRFISLAVNPASSTVNATYMGIRCLTGESKVYARHHSETGWKNATDAQWKLIFNTDRLSFRLAREGLCMSSIPNGTPTEMVRALRTVTGIGSGS